MLAVSYDTSLSLSPPPSGKLEGFMSFCPLIISSLFYLPPPGWPWDIIFFEFYRVAL